MSVIYKILTPQQWNEFQQEGHFYGSSMDQKDGFIHCAQENQYPKIKEKFFANQSPLILLSIDIKNLPEGALKIESNRPGGDEYPHLYSSLTLKAVVSSKTLE